MGEVLSLQVINVHFNLRPDFIMVLIHTPPHCLPSLKSCDLVSLLSALAFLLQK